ADRSKTLLFSIQDRDMFSLVVDNSTFDVLWSNELTLIDTDLHSTCRKILLTNEGTILVLLEENNNKSNRDRHTLKLLKSSGTSDFFMYDILVNDAYGSSLEAAFDNV